MNKNVTPIRSTPVPRTPELPPMPREDFEDSCIADDITGVVGDSLWEAAMDALDSQWGIA